MHCLKNLMIVSVFLFFGAISSILRAGTCGEIDGTVLEKSSRAPLAGASITIAETGQVLETDSHGSFHFLGIPANNYTLKIQLNGYRPMRIEQVWVQPEMTTSVPVLLEPDTGAPEAVETGSRTQLRFDKLAFGQEMTADEISFLPMSLLAIPNIEDLPRSSTAQFVPALFSVENALPGARVLRREGTADFTADLQYSTNQIGSGTFQHQLGNYYTTYENKTNSVRPIEFFHPEQLQYLEFFLSGRLPLLARKINYVLSIEKFQTAGILPNQADQELFFDGALVYRPTPDMRLALSGGKGQREFTTYDHFWKNTTYEAQTDSTNETAAGRDLNGDGVIGGWVPGTDLNHDGDFQDAFSLLDHLPRYRSDFSGLQLEWTHNLTPKLFYEIELVRKSSRLRFNVEEKINEDTDGDGHLDLFVNRTDLDGDGDNRHEDLNGNQLWDWQVYGPDTDLFRDENNNDWIDASENGTRLEWADVPFGYFRDWKGYFIYGYDANLPFSPARWSDESWVRYGANTRLTWQIAEKRTWRNQIKVGTHFQYLEVKHHGVWHRGWGVTDLYHLARFQNSRGVFLQNKFQLKPGSLPVLHQLTLVLGGRLEDFDPNLPEEKTAAADSFSTPGLSEPEVPIPSRTRWLARGGLSFSFSRRDKFFVNYQEFAEYTLLQPYYLGNLPDEQKYFEPQRICDTEYGVAVDVPGWFKLEAAGFNEEFAFFNQFGAYIFHETWYRYFQPFSRANRHGGHLALTTGKLPFFESKLNYTYSETKSKPGDATSSYEYTWAGDISEPTAYYLDWDRRHELFAYGRFFTQANAPVWRANCSATLQFTYRSGLPYSPPQRTKEKEINTERLPSTSCFDLKVQKAFSFRGLGTTLFIEVHNLFDRLNIVSVADVNWYHTYKTITEEYEKGELSQDDYYELMDQMDPFDRNGDGISGSQPDGVIDYNKAHPEMGKELNPAVYGPRRRIYCGLKFSW